MAEQEKTYYYRPVPGSRELITSATDADAALREIEAARESSPEPTPQREYKGVWLGGARFDPAAEGVLAPLSIFDALAPKQTTLEQAVYLHLFRLSYGEGRNWRRVGKRELMGRAGLSDRRLNVVLDGLVRKGHLKPLHRNTEGTLYRVYLPSEVLGTLPEPGLSLGRKIETKPALESRPPGTSDQPRRLRPREKPLESPLNEERWAELSGKAVKGPGLSEMADWFFSRKGRRPSAQERQLALTTLTDLLEDGFSRDEVKVALEWFVLNQGEETSIERLPYFITKALEAAEKNK